jgi:hypothetical protein
MFWGQEGGSNRHKKNGGLVSDCRELRLGKSRALRDEIV